ncbi:MarR family winged helix-turn-helix transcriptional regulator [Aurantimicrobium minutum]|uniref:MarR family winged helix-turn-helix transcriptional regulator n=1 Tax=Aurantimicrobium minutum TaxID=708131 RepID=UPI002476C375|nr:MarR family winged helix-turn-helix transcriptional regulator [Aurantimicrobium minutum]MDH6239919.1 DNA-binding MarR family transcriptional regulator [Aurantimicrobium minutum]
MSEETREPQKHTGFLLRRAQQKHVATWQETISGDTTSVQYNILAVLNRRPGSAQKELCEELDIDRSTIADVCTRMEKNGLVTRVPAEDDRRRNVLELTELGQRELARLRPLVEEVQRGLTSPLSAEEHQELRRLLAKLVD